MNVKTLFQLTILTAVLSALPACTSSVLSKRTDEQMWLDFQKELKLRRTPASVNSVEGDFGIQKLHEQLEDVPLRKILLSCQVTEAAERCYQAKLLVAFDEVFRKSKAKTAALSDVLYKKEQQAFMKERSYEVVSAEVQNFHQVLLSGMDLRAADHVRDLNHDCETASDSPVQAYQPFSGGSFDLPKSYFACLNNEWEKDAGHLLEETTSRLGLEIVTSEALEWIKQKQIYPVYDEITRSLLAKKAAENLQSWNHDLEGHQNEMDFSLSLQAFVKKESEALRSQYPYLPIEARLTELYQKHQKVQSRGVPSL